MDQPALRNTTIQDAEQLLAVFCNPDVVRFTNFRQFTDISALKTFLERFLAIGQGQPLQYGPYSIFTGNQLAGLCGLQQKELALGSAELWYILGKEHWGKGLAKATVEKLIKEAATNKQLRSIYAEAVTTNPASWRILEKQGFLQTGELKNGFQKETIVADLRSYSLVMNA